MERYAPILVTVYDRLYTFRSCIESLLLNDLAGDSELYVISDAPSCKEHEEAVNNVREYAKSLQGFKCVHCIFHLSNLGSHVSGETGIRLVLEDHDTFIYLEDDIVVSNDFLNYMNDGLRFYKEDPAVHSICGFCSPFQIPDRYKQDVWFSPMNSPWGYATWKDKWEKVDYSAFDRYAALKRSHELKRFMSVGFYIKGILIADSKGEITAGDLRIYYHMFRHNMCSVFPVVSKTQNWGFDGSGEHCGCKRAWWAKPELDTRNQPTKFIPFNGYDKELLKNHRAFQDKINGGFLAKYLKYTWVHRLYNKLK